MSGQSLKNGPNHVFAIWLLCLVVFMAIMAFVLLRGPASQSELSKGHKSAAEALKIVREAAGGYVLGNIPEKDGLRNPVLPPAPFAEKGQYALVGFGLQGFYQISPSSLVWELDLPERVMEVQLIQRGPSPGIVTENVRVSWQLAPDANLTHTNTTGIEPAAGEMSLNASGSAFRASIPVTVQNGDGLFNPYLVLNFKAEDASDGRLLARSSAVLAVSPGFGCDHCHADGEYAILRAHDQRNGTDFEQTAASGGTVQCYGCHTGVDVDGDKTESTGMPGFSAAIHGWHAPYLKGRAEDACLTCHIGLGRADDAREPEPLFPRDMHMAVGLDCTRCHGYMEDHALALLAAEEKAGLELARARIGKIAPRLVANTAAIEPRLPWVQLPDCLSCHDFENRPDPSEATAFNKWTELTEGDGALFSRRADDMGAVRCITCHGAPHALYPAENPVGRNRDNLPPMQYQKLAYVFGGQGNCAVCHMQDMPMSAHHPIIGE